MGREPFLIYNSFIRGDVCLGDVRQGSVISPEVCCLEEEVLGGDGDMVARSNFSDD